jgi:hypothetical protein
MTIFQQKDILGIILQKLLQNIDIDDFNEHGIKSSIIYQNSMWYDFAMINTYCHEVFQNFIQQTKQIIPNALVLRIFESSYVGNFKTLLCGHCDEIYMDDGDHSEDEFESDPICETCNKSWCFDCHLDRDNPDLH